MWDVITVDKYSLFVALEVFYFHFSLWPSTGAGPWRESLGTRLVWGKDALVLHDTVIPQSILPHTGKNEFRCYEAKFKSTYRGL